jgi:hypothetical protein
MKKLTRERLRSLITDLALFDYPFLSGRVRKTGGHAIRLAAARDYIRRTEFARTTIADVVELLAVFDFGAEVVTVAALLIVRLIAAAGERVSSTNSFDSEELQRFEMVIRPSKSECRRSPLRRSPSSSVIR